MGAWNQPDRGLLDAIKGVIGTPGGGGGSFATDFQGEWDNTDYAAGQLVTRTASLWMANGQGASSMDIPGNSQSWELILAGPKPGAVRYRGAYADAGPDFAAGDMVTDAGRVLLCTEDYTRSAVPAGALGSTAVPYPAAVTDIPLPPGCATGDLALIAAVANGIPGYATLVHSQDVGGGGNTPTRLSSYVLTDADITAGHLSLPASTSGVLGGATLSVFRGVTADTANLVASATLTAPATTPAGGGYLYHYSVSATSGGVAVATQAALTDVVSAGAADNAYTACGYETDTGAASTPRAWSWGDHGTTNPAYLFAGVLPLVGGAIDLSKFDVLSST